MESPIAAPIGEYQEDMGLREDVDFVAPQTQKGVATERPYCIRCDVSAAGTYKYHLLLYWARFRPAVCVHKEVRLFHLAVIYNKADNWMGKGQNQTGHSGYCPL